MANRSSFGIVPDPDDKIALTRFLSNISSRLDLVLNARGLSRTSATTNDLKLVISSNQESAVGLEIEENQQDILVRLDEIIERLEKVESYVLPILNAPIPRDTNITRDVL